MSDQKCANCDKEFDDEVVKARGSNLCEECADKLFNDREE